MENCEGGKVRLFVIGLVMVLVTSWLTVPKARAEGDNGGDRTAGGAFTCDFALGPTAFQGNLAAAIERDRMYMSAQPGMLQKHIPFLPDPHAAADGGLAYAGGRYLFDTLDHANKYETFVTQQFTLDGVQFLHRDYFKNPTCHAWQVLGAHDFAPIDHQLVVRTEWLDVNNNADLAALQARWPAVRGAANARGYTSVWLLWRPDPAPAQTHAQAALVYFTDRTSPDAAGVALLAASPPLGEVLLADHPGWTQSFDRTEWALTIWFPFVRGDQGPPALWPYSMFPSPGAPGADGLCEPSRGESFTNDQRECLPTCGNGKPDDGETTKNCPSDVPWDEKS